MSASRGAFGVNSVELQKVCSQCSQSKSIKEFRADRLYCRRCQYLREKRTVLNWKVKNRKRDLSLMRLWRQRHILSRKLSVVRRDGYKVKGLLKILEKMFESNPYCAYCKIKLDVDNVSLDHKIPISKGGPSNDPNNWVLCCQDCNYLKRVRTPEEFISFAKEYAKRFLDNTEPSQNILEGVTTSSEIKDTNAPTLDHSARYGLNHLVTNGSWE